MPVPTEDEPDAGRGALDAAALDDYLAGFTAEPPAGAAIDGDEPDAAGILDTILLLRQAVKPDGESPALPAVPQSIGRHAILRLAGEGGFATVWQGFDTLLRRPVAVKVRRPELLLSADARRRFVREAEIAARLVHPHIVTIYEVGEDAGREFIAAEYCSGGSLAEWLDRHPGPLPPRTAARLVRAIAGAVACAHDAGVVHRDIKPANVLLVPAPPGSEPILAGVSPEAPGLTVKLGDFGLGKVHDEIDAADPLTQLTRTGARIGTPAWMAPEQVDRSVGAIGPATDVHALGLLLDRLLTGRSLRGGTTDTEIYRQVLIDEPVPADRVVRGVPRDLAAVAAKCLARQPADRYATAADLAADLDHWLAGRPTRARPVSLLGHAARLVRRRPVVATLAAVALAALGGAAWVGLERSREVARREQEIRQQRGLEEIRRGFEALRAGNVAAAVEQLDKTRAVDSALADSLAGRWLARRTHGEREILLALAAESGDGKRPRDLYSIALAPDGATAAVAGADGSIHLLRELDGRPTAITIAAHDEVNDVAFSPEGSLVASAGQDGRLRWWRLTPAGLVTAGEARPGTGPLYAAAWSPDGRAIATGGEDRTVRLVNLEAPDHAVDLFAFDAPADKAPDIESLTFVSPQMLAASCGNTVVLLDAATGRLVRACESPVEPHTSVVFGGLVVTADGGRLMACGTDAKAHVWDVATGRLTVSLPGHPAWVQGCAFSADGSRIATACRDGGLRIFDAQTGRVLDRRVGHVGRIWSVAWEPAGTLLTAGADGTVRRWDVQRSAETAMFTNIPLTQSSVEHVVEARPGPGAASPVLLAVGDGAAPCTIDLAAGVARPFVASGVNRVWRVAADRRSERLAISRRTGDPVLVMTHTAPAAAVPVALPAPADPTDALVAWTPAGDLVVRSFDGGLFWCASGTGAVQRVGAAAGVVTDLATAPAGPPRVAIAGDRAAISPLPRSAGGSAQQSPPLDLAVVGQSSAVAWSPDGTLVAVGARSGAVHLFAAATGTSLGLFAPHERAIEGLAFSREGRILVAADETCVRISDVATLATLDELRPGFKVRALLVTADGSRLLVGGHAGDLPTAGSGRLSVMNLPSP